MYCAPFACHLSPEACERNQDLARGAIDKIHDGSSVHEITEQEVNRMLVCGACDDSDIDRDRMKAAFRQGISELIDTVNGFDELRSDPEVSRIRRKLRQQRYRSGGNHGTTEESRSDEGPDRSHDQEGKG